MEYRVLALMLGVFLLIEIGRIYIGTTEIPLYSVYVKCWLRFSPEEFSCSLDSGLYIEGVCEKASERKGQLGPDRPMLHHGY